MQINLGNTIGERYEWEAVKSRIDALKCDGEYFPGATNEEIAQIESLYECELHPVIRDSLKFANGCNLHSWQSCFRLMTTVEILEFHSFWKQLGGVLTKWKLIFFWTNDNSDYAGVFCDGPLSGTVLLLQHEMAVWAPQFLGMCEFLDKVKDESVEDVWKNWGSTTFPLFVQNVAESDAAMLDLYVAECLKLAEEETDMDMRRQFHETAIYLVHPDRVETMLRFLDFDDIWIPQIAAELIGKRRLEIAIPNLVQLMLRGKPNGDTAAIEALQEIGTARACDALKRLRGKGRWPQINAIIDEAIMSFGDR